MYNIEIKEDLAINARFLLNSDKKTLEDIFTQHDVDPKSLDDMLRNIHEWYQKQLHLPAGQLHDHFLVRLLVMRKFSIEKVKQKIDSYYSVRPRMAEFLSQRDPMDPNLNKCLKNGYWIPFPQRTLENYRVTIFRLKPNEDVSGLDLIKVLFMLTDYRIWNDSVVGEKVILDFKNVTLQLVLQMKPIIVSKVLFYVTECLSPKIKGIYVVNLPSYAETVFSFCKKILKPKIVKRINLYKSLDEVLKIFPEHMFPKDLGGTAEVTCQEIIDAWEKTLCSTPWRNFFIEQDSIHSDETKRITKTSICSFCDDFGLDGSFKTLNID